VQQRVQQAMVLQRTMVPRQQDPSAVLQPVPDAMAAVA
jgi:hypothetical protein